MTNRPRLLDLFCGAGGCSVGYHRAGFDVVGVDIEPQPNYPFAFRQADALQTMRDFLNGYDMPAANHYWQLRDFAVIHASPPCQLHSAAKRIGNGRPEHQDHVAETRRLLEATGKPWVIENVPGAPLRSPLVLCGTQFGLRLRRHRLFESSEFLIGCQEPCRHKDGDLTVFGCAVQACGSKAKAYKDASGRTHWRQKRLSLAHGRAAMGIDWMNRGELSQAIPPAYCHFIGKQLLNAIAEPNPSLFATEDAQ